MMKRILLLLLIPFAAHAGELREDTATQVAIGPFLDGTDGVTAETALTVTEWDCDLVKHADSGMAVTALTITASAGSNDAAHLTSGMYSLELTATDTNTAGRLVLICDHATPTTFMAVRHEWMVMPTQEFDSLYGTDVLQVHAVEIANDLITASAIAADAIGASEIATDAIAADELAAGALAEINAEVVDALNTDTYAEPGQGTPASTATLAAKINYLYKAWRNRSTQTSTTYSLYNDDATTVDQKATVSDDATTFDKTEVVSGP